MSPKTLSDWRSGTIPRDEESLLKVVRAAREHLRAKNSIPGTPETRRLLNDGYWERLYRNAKSARKNAVSHVAERAQEVYAGLDPQQQKAVPGILLRLVAVGEDAEYALRSAREEEFATDQATEQDVQEVLQAFTKSGVLVRTGDRIMLSHVALIQAWPDLHEWVQAESGALAIHQELADAARSWEQLDRNGSVLFHGAMLERALTLTEPGRHFSLNPTERAFVHEGTRLAVRRVRQRNLVIAVLAVLLVAAIGAGMGIFVQGRTVTRQRDRAVGIRIANVATTMRRTDPATAKQLAVAAAALAPGSHEARNALITLHSQWEQYVYRPRGLDETWKRAVDGTGHLMVYARGDQVRVADVDARTVAASFTLGAEPGQDIADLSLSSDGRQLAVGLRGGTVGLWDTATGRREPTAIRTPVPWPVPRLSPKRTRVLVASSGEAKAVWDTSSGKPVLTLPSHTDDAGTAFTPDDRYLVIARDMTLEFWDLTTGTQGTRHPPCGSLPVREAS
ncbi:nSTAND1 domain-containing NTPase [Actinomadura rupiterrae]|uniref:nSTAND1 domain-containing NTPase n=1 Tax=Actinomadura rupiterrae TaxID=559627 RepID=UPI0020A413D7|nr:hypothetical protein [Actinomadura rupiterrae]MCP2343084.1 hypothetical protein [Actinomadura rupiterrae]